VSVPDPVDGPPWGLRYLETTRRTGCLQAGRLVRGQVGVIGQDGAFDNDGLFHPLAQNYLGAFYAGPFPCGLLDAHGHAFAAVSMHGVPASALMLPSARNLGCVAHRDHGPIGRRPNQPSICPRNDWRLLYFGMAGPEAKSVTYVAGGTEHTVQTVGDQGAYLIVLRADLSRIRQLGSFSTLPSAGGGPIVRIDYRNGFVCRAHQKLDNGSSQGLCPPVGQVLAARPRVTSADVASPIRTELRRSSLGLEAVVSFVARVPVTDASASYGGVLRLSGSGVNCRAIVGGGTDKDIKAGQRVHFRFPTSGCHGRFHGTISYLTKTGVPLMPDPIPGPDTPLVGHFTVNVP